MYPNGQVALDDVNLYVNRGEFIYVVGPSGSGKSTLLKLIFSSEKPSKGDILIDNHSLKALNKKHIPYLRRNIGMIFQDFKLLNSVQCLKMLPLL